MNPRIRRLRADHQHLCRVFEHHPRIRIVEADGQPPEKYVVEFHVLGLVPQPDAKPGQRVTHRAEIFLPLDYPRHPPFCRMTTPVFHPNIDPVRICIGDHWSAGQSLALLVVRIAEMITYQSYNIQSPLNGEAAAWAAANRERLPLEQIDLTTGL